MLLILETPYKEKYIRGYLRKRKEDNRQIVTLLKENGKQTVTSYARYLMSTHLGIELPEDVEVDHIDNDKTNDSLDNLQILTKAQHYQKTASFKSRPMTECVCPICQKIFRIKTSDIPFKPNPTCSRKCGCKKGFQTRQKRAFNN